MSKPYLLAALLLLLFIAPAAHSQTAPMHPLLLVANQKDHTLSIVDPKTNAQIAAVDVQGVTGHEVTASPDGRFAFVPIYGSSGVGKAGTDGDKIDVIDLASHKIIHVIQFSHGVRPHLPVFDPTGHTLYVTTELDQTITAIDPKTYAIIGSIPTTEPESHMFVFSHDGKRAYTANVGSGTVSVLDVKARKTLTVIKIAPVTQRISISPDDSMVFTSDQTQPRLAVIDTASNTVKGWVTLPALGYGTAATPDGRWLLVAIPTKSEVAVVDLHTLQVVRTVAVTGKPQEVLVRPDGKEAYVSCGKPVAVIDLSNWSVPAQIEAGVGADGLGWAR